MQQEDRLKWAELISKDRDAFFSLNKSDYDEDLLTMCLKKGIHIGDIYDKFGGIAYRFVENIYIEMIKESTNSLEIKFLSDKIINAIISKFKAIDKHSKSYGVDYYSGVFRRTYDMEDWRSIFVRYNINLIRDYFKENVKTIYHTVSPDGKASFVRYAEDDITNEFLNVLAQAPLREEDINKLMPWVDGMIVEVNNKRQRINREFTNNDIVWFRDSLKDFDSFDSYISDIVVTISCEIRYNNRNEHNKSQMFGTHKYNKEILSKVFELLDSPFLINRYSDIKFTLTCADNKPITHSDVMEAVVKEIMTDSDYEYLKELLKEEDEHVVNIMETVDIDLRKNHKPKVVNDYKSKKELFFEKYGWFLGFFSSVAIVVVVSIILYILIF